MRTMIMMRTTHKDMDRDRDRDRDKDRGWELLTCEPALVLLGCSEEEEEEEEEEQEEQDPISCFLALSPPPVAERAWD